MQPVRTLAKPSQRLASRSLTTRAAGFRPFARPLSTSVPPYTYTDYVLAAGAGGMMADAMCSVYQFDRKLSHLVELVHRLDRDDKARKELEQSRANYLRWCASEEAVRALVGKNGQASGKASESKEA